MAFMKIERDILKILLEKKRVGGRVVAVGCGGRSGGGGRSWRGWRGGVDYGGVDREHRAGEKLQLH